MKSSLLLLSMILSVVSCGDLWAQGKNLAAEVSIGPTQIDIKGNRAKLNEYRDLRNGFHGNIGFRYDAERNYLDFRADDMGYKDQKFELDGGRRGSFTYHLGYEEIPHNFSFGNGQLKK